MKTIQVPDFDSLPATDKELESWTLSWQPDGRCDSFTREAILACAPATSGVYGLFNFNCQLFIGESANIQEVLLRLESGSDFHAQHLRPTGFTFEPCAVELRKAKASELIARFRPVLQTLADLRKTAPAADPITLEEVQVVRESESDFDPHEFRFLGEKRPKVHRFHFDRTRRSALAVALVAAATMLFYFRPAGNESNPANPMAEQPAQRTSIAQSPVSRQIKAGSKPQNAPSRDAPRTPGKQNVDPIPAAPNIPTNASGLNGTVRLAATKATSVDEMDVRMLRAKTTPAGGQASGSFGKKWSVQISAAPAKDVADNLAQRLIAQGYNGYVAQAEVKGQTYYRVRVGPFDARENAESARQSLARQEDYRDAYLTGD